MFKKFKMQLTLIRPMLGTNPLDPHVLDNHIIQKARQLITKESKIDKAINKYKDAVQIPDARAEKEADLLLKRLEQRLGGSLDQEILDAIACGRLDEFKETLPELAEKGITVFFRDDNGMPCIGDHMIYGFMKAATEAIGRTLGKKGKGKVMESVSYTQSLINQHVRCEEDFITFDKDIARTGDDFPNYLQRSLRAMTAQGPRITVTKSEQVFAGANLNFTLKVMKGSPLLSEYNWEGIKNAPAIELMFDYGEVCGLGQWRNAHYGAFSYQMSEV